MPVILVATLDVQSAKEAQVKWLVEDIWLYEDGDAELQLECIIASKAKLEEITIIISSYVDSVEDLTSLYRDPSYQREYPLCWPDLYSQFEINIPESSVYVNGIKARVNKIDVSLGYKTSRYTEIKIKFDPPIINENRIFRVSLCCKDMVVRRKFISPLAKRSLRIYTYGMTPFSGSDLDVLLREREIDKNKWLSLEKYIVYVKWGIKTLFIESFIYPSPRIYPFGPCEVLPRRCPPLQQISKRIRKSVVELKNKEAFSMVWEYENIPPTRGQLIVVDYYTSLLQKWISKNWFALIAFSASLLSLLLSISKFF